MENGHEWVDLGLPSGLKWATCNIGASSPEAYGDYFAWGETEPKEDYSWETYKWCNGSAFSLTKYNTSSSSGTADGKIRLDNEDDAARVNRGSNWRMPTDAEITELRTNCTWTLSARNGVDGYEVTSNSNGNSIFLPLSGDWGGTNFFAGGGIGYFWSSDVYMFSPRYAYCIYFSSDEVKAYMVLRNYGFAIRPVTE